MYFAVKDEDKAPKEASTQVEQLDPSDAPDNHADHPDPFLLTDSKVMTGQGKALVCAVGESTMATRNRKKNSLVMQEEKTHLEGLLERLGNGVREYAYQACLWCIAAQAVFLILLIVFNDEVALFSNATLMRCAKIGVVAVVMLIVSVPEGLPVAVSIAMAMSTESLKRDGILIKKLESVQTCAMLRDICVGKTGTLTESNITVKSYQITNDKHAVVDQRDENPAFFNTQLEIQEELKKIIRESIISNTDVRIEADNKDCTYKPTGQALEVGLIQFLMDNGVDVPNVFFNRNRFARKLVQLPFDQNLKRKVVVRKVAGRDGAVRVYVKGAPEYVIPACSTTLNHQVKQVRFSP